jgi:hypothetical protein
MNIQKLKFPLKRQPNAKSFFDDLKESSPIPEPIYHPVVTEDNIEYVKAQFDTEDVQIGDTVHSWDNGRWDNGRWGRLAGRAGLQLKRNGKDIRFILTRIS